MKEINNCTDEIYESFFETEEQLHSSISKLISILNLILSDLKHE
jgi:hypothetical protein